MKDLPSLQRKGQRLIKRLGQLAQVFFFRDNQICVLDEQHLYTRYTAQF